MARIGSAATAAMATRASKASTRALWLRSAERADDVDGSMNVLLGSFEAGSYFKAAGVIPSGKSSEQ